MSVRINPGRLRHELARRGLSVPDLAREAKLSLPTVRAAMSGRPISPSSSRLIGQALGRVPVLEALDLLLLDDDVRGLV